MWQHVTAWVLLIAFTAFCLAVLVESQGSTLSARLPDAIARRLNRSADGIARVIEGAARSGTDVIGNRVVARTWVHLRLSVAKRAQLDANLEMYEAHAARALGFAIKDRAERLGIDAAPVSSLRIRPSTGFTACIITNDEGSPWRFVKEPRSAQLAAPVTALEHLRAASADDVMTELVVEPPTEVIPTPDPDQFRRVAANEAEGDPITEWIAFLASPDSFAMLRAWGDGSSKLIGRDAESWARIAPHRTDVSRKHATIRFGRTEAIMETLSTQVTRVLRQGKEIDHSPDFLVLLPGDEIVLGANAKSRITLAINSAVGR
ncbi:FHA domain-containing protein [Rathayibacter sp. AY1C6]|uniref:FHA domain-containing protein n=1 Tax=Rathayibacter sp. AY1C6 TaxID=2080539 RepID=UPI0011AFD2EF|nr:FHA domain-containing protein [Rathayibacter sp. AY1C6]